MQQIPNPSQPEQPYRLPLPLEQIQSPQEIISGTPVAETGISATQANYITHVAQAEATNPQETGLPISEDRSIKNLTSRIANIQEISLQTPDILLEGKEHQLGIFADSGQVGMLEQIFADNAGLSNPGTP